MIADATRRRSNVSPARRAWAGIAWAAAVAATIGSQFLAQSRWNGAEAYSLARYNISDLGNATCRAVGSPSRDVCSPWHLATNVGFVAFGVLMIVGVALLGPLWSRSRSGLAAAALLVLSGTGSAIVGFAPADTHRSMHMIGAGLVFICSNLAMLAAAPTLLRAGGRAASRLGIVLGAAGLAAAALFITDHFLGLGMGGMERVTVWAVDVWMLAVAFVLLRARGSFSS